MSKKSKTRATIQVNNGPEMDLDEIQKGGAAFDNFAEQVKTLLHLDERAKETGIEFHASLDRVSQDAEGERKIVFKVPRSDSLAVDIVSHWVELPLRIQVFVEKRWVQGSWDELHPHDANNGDGESDDE